MIVNVPAFEQNKGCSKSPLIDSVLKLLNYHSTMLVSIKYLHFVFISRK